MAEGIQYTETLQQFGLSTPVPEAAMPLVMNRMQINDKNSILALT